MTLKGKETIILKVGMIVELEDRSTYLVMPSSVEGDNLILMSREGAYSSNNLEINKDSITHVYRRHSGLTYYTFFEYDELQLRDLVLLWTKINQTPQEAKIEELRGLLAKQVKDHQESHMAITKKIEELEKENK